jgi:hypothetical protein
VKDRRLRQQLTDLDRDLDDLSHGACRWQHTPAGEVARALQDARDAVGSARHLVMCRDGGRLARLRASRSLPRLHAALRDAEQRWDRDCRPLVDELRGERRAILDNLGRPEALRRGDWLDQHPDLARHLDGLTRDLDALGGLGRRMPTTSEPIPEAGIGL